MQRAMEQTKYWMWTRRRLSESPLHSYQTPIIFTNSSYSSSWEEEAFAQDSAAQVGDCKWPPRSYSCSFCRREFQSAQALGGHMNVHRRDRARLKQSSSESYEEEDHHAHHSGKTIDTQDSLLQLISSPVCNSNTCANPNCGAIASSPLSPSGVSVAPTKENLSEDILISPYSSSHIRENVKELFHVSSTVSAKISIPVQAYDIPELNIGREKLRLRKAGGCQVRRDPDEDDEVITNSSKRRRSDPPILLSLRPSVGERCQQTQTDVLKLSLSPVEELDLELRLGDPPKVK